MQRICANAWCSQPFEVTPDDLAFYEKVSPVFNGKKELIPPPTRCPECRRQRKLVWRNERSFYQRPCGACGRRITTVHSPENSYPVYCLSCWRGSTWNALSYGRTFDSSQSFFAQFRALYDSVPQRAVVSEEGLTCQNCEYCFDTSYSRNCYFIFGMWKCEDCLYCNISDQSKFCVDCYGVKLDSEFVYESLDSQHLYRCLFLQNSENCSDCAFGFDLKGCRQCLGCVNLRQKEYCIFNEQYTQSEYKDRLHSFALSTNHGLEHMKNEFATFVLRFPHRALNFQHCEDCIGDHLFHCKNVLGYVSTNAENARWIERSDGPMNSYDIVQSGSPQWCLEQITGDNTYAVHFSMYCNHSKYLLYCSDCLSCEHCIGCISLRNQKYCIFNTQYTPEEYERIASTVIHSMRNSGEWGEFFPESLSPFGYSETNAREFYPLPDSEIRARGWFCRTDRVHTKGKETISVIPESINNVPDDILKEIFACFSCEKNFKIIQQELDFYRTMDIPLPRLCPDCRHSDRLRRRNPFTLFTRTCMKCQKPIQTSYAPGRPEIVYCECCYLESVY